MNSAKSTQLIPILVLLALLVSTGCDTVDPPPPGREVGEFTITSEQVADGPSMKHAFVAEGFIEDRGIAVDSLESTEPLDQRGSVHGWKTLSGGKGEIEIEFYVTLFRIDGITLHAVGGFKITDATDHYAGLQGTGEINLVLALSESPYEIARRLEGVAEYVDS